MELQPDLSDPGRILREMAPLMLAVARNHPTVWTDDDARDVVQEASLRLLEHPFDPDCGIPPRSWVAQCVRWTADDKARKEIRRRPLQGEGWHRDPFGSSERWFDGRNWTDRVRTSGGAVARDGLSGDERSRKRPRVAEVGLDALGDDVGTPAESAGLDDLRSAIIERLGPELGGVLVSHHLDGFDVAEIAAAFDKHPGTIGRWLRKARREAKAQLIDFVEPDA